MLVLTRKLGEQILIGDDIVITVVAQQGDRVKLGFEAPPHVTIHRKEVYERVRQEERAAQAPASPIAETNDHAYSCLAYVI